MNKAHVNFKIIAKDWYKRRQLTGKERYPVDVTIADYQAIHNHMCQMKVRYNDGSEKSLIARVIYNKLTDKWTVDGMEVAVTVVGT